MEWEPWFAWHPVTVNGQWVWWHPIERKVICYGMEVFVWYRLKEAGR